MDPIRCTGGDDECLQLPMEVFKGRISQIVSWAYNDQMTARTSSRQLNPGGQEQIGALAWTHATYRNNDWVSLTDTQRMPNLVSLC